MSPDLTLSRRVVACPGWPSESAPHPAKRPTNPTWRVTGESPAFGTRYERHRLVVTSMIHPGEAGGWEWSVAVSMVGAVGGRPGDEEMARVRRDFGMTEALEDNHSPNKLVRALWLNTDPDLRRPCPCEETEMAVVLPAGMDGSGVYVWREAP